jgi:hypothetical protein
MENSPEQELPELVRQVQTHLRDGKPEAARTLLIQYVRKNPNSELGWDLLSQVVTAPREQADCLRQVLRLNPHNQEAQARLKRLLAQAPAPNRAAPPRAPAPAEVSQPSPSETPEAPSAPAPVAPPPAIVPTDQAEPVPGKTPEPSPPPAPSAPPPMPAEPMAYETAPAAPGEPVPVTAQPGTPIEARPGEEPPRLAAEPAAGAEPEPKARPQRGLSCARFFWAAILVAVITLGVAVALAAIILLPPRLKPAEPSSTPVPTLPPASSLEPSITPTLIRFPTLPPAWTATFTLSPTPVTPSSTPAFTSRPPPSETPAKTPTETPTAGGPAGFGTPMPSLVAALSAENVVSLTQVALWQPSAPALTFTCLAVAPNGRTIAVGANDGTVRLWRASDGGGERVLMVHTQTVSSLAFSPDGETLISGANDKTVRLWGVTEGALVRTFEGHTAEVTSVAFAPNGKSIASGSLDGTTRVWNVSDGNLSYQVKGKVAGLAFSPDGQILAIAGGDRIKLTRASSGAVSLSLKAASAAWERLAFSPDGKTLAASSAPVPAQLWRASDGSLVRSFNAAPPKSTATRLSGNVTFSPDGQLLASGTVDGLILVWQVSDGALKASLETGASEVLQVVFAPDGKALFSLSLDGTLRVWAAP